MTVLPFGSPEDWDAAAAPVHEHLTGAGLLAYPTETVYGLGSRATEEGVRAVARLKGRPGGKPFLLLISRREMAERHGLVFTPAADALARVFWPGPLTLVLATAGGQMPDALRGPEGGIAVRLTSHRGMRRLIAALDEPITSTSANRPGGPPAPGARAVLDLFGDAARSGSLLVLDGGVLGNVPPSTVVDCTGPEARLIREGALPRRELRAATGKPIS